MCQMDLQSFPEEWSSLDIKLKSNLFQWSFQNVQKSTFDSSRIFTRTLSFEIDVGCCKRSQHEDRWWDIDPFDKHVGFIGHSKRPWSKHKHFTLCSSFLKIQKLINDIDNYNKDVWISIINRSNCSYSKLKSN